MRDAVQRYVVFAVCVRCLVSHHACTHHACPVAGRCRRRDRAFREGGVIPWLIGGVETYQSDSSPRKPRAQEPVSPISKRAIAELRISRNLKENGSRDRNSALAPGYSSDGLGLVPDRQLCKPGASERQSCMPGALPSQTLSRLRLWGRRLAYTSLPRRSEPLEERRLQKQAVTSAGAPEAPRSQPLLLVAPFPLKAFPAAPLARSRLNCARTSSMVSPRCGHEPSCPGHTSCASGADLQVDS